jgi:hypothetical protein
VVGEDHPFPSRKRTRPVLVVNMRSLLIQGEIEAAELGEVLPGAGAKVQTSLAYAFGATHVALFVGRKFTFRSNDYLGIVLMTASDGTTQRVDVSYAGGGSGILGAVWGAGRDIEDAVGDAIRSIAQRRGLQCSEISPAEGG